MFSGEDVSAREPHRTPQIPGHYTIMLDISVIIRKNKMTR
jgi:hypothetical protein|tara:strand:- start:341 stop:460 length:120 start_codon:yes stop_codon:yes gene_type:complete